MPRKRRVFVPGVSAHIVKRGNNRGSIFSRTDDYESFLGLLKAAAPRHGTAIHGFVLMTTHVHILATPEGPASIPAMMKELGERYSRYFNGEYSRSGTPWDGRYRAFVIEDERYLLTCLRYVELNPVRAGMVLRAEDYRWSSYAVHALGSSSDWLVPHAVFAALGRSAAERAVVYRKLCDARLSEEEVRRIRTTSRRKVVRGQTPGSDPGVRPHRARSRRPVHRIT
jgi:putative transposase